MKTHWKWTVSAEIPLERADKVLVAALQAGLGKCSPSERERELRDLSRNRLHQLMANGQVLLEGRSVGPSDRVRLGFEITIELPEAEPTEVLAENIPIERLFEDAHLLVVNKPPGLTVHPSDGHLTGTLVNALLFHVKDLSGIGGKLRPGIVHRLDKDTSGALVITKTDECHHRLSEVFSKHDVERKYWALCYSTPKHSGEFRVESQIGRNPSDRKKMAMNVKDGRKAITHFKKLKEFGDTQKAPFASWVEARLETGRTHQVRVHATGEGFSLLGDPTYGVPSSNAAKWKSLPPEIQSAVQELPGQALHARVLGFTHPITGEKLRFEAEPPQKFAALLRILNSYS